MPPQQSESTSVLDAVRHALTAEPRIDIARHPIRLAYVDGVLTIEGELPTVAAKKLALIRAGAEPEVHHVVDRLCVAPAKRMTDGEIRDHVRDALLQEPALAECSIHVWVKGARGGARSPDSALGAIDVRVEEGIVTLDGEVPGLGRKRMAGVLAWWVPGSCDVINAIGIDPPEDDNDEMIADAVRMALEKDPFVDAGQVRVGVSKASVLLAGLVPTQAEREMAEFDAWYVFGVDDVRNRIEVRAGPSAPAR